MRQRLEINIVEKKTLLSNTVIDCEVIQTAMITAITIKRMIILPKQH
jgi:hypothetical protein